MNFRGLGCGAALLLVLAGSQAEAAWNNAFQVTCFGCRNRSSQYRAAPPVVAYSAPIVAHAAPDCGCCTTAYVQRCYYQPVTTYKTVLEPVTSYKTSYYWEPTCSYRTSCYVDPCTGQSVQVSQPVTSYRLRSQCNAVTSYVQRCVPTVAYRQAFRLEPVTICPGGVTSPGGTLQEGPATDGNRLPKTNVPMTEGNLQEYQPGSLRPSTSPSLKPGPDFNPRMDKITNRIGGATIRGQVVANNFVSPLKGAKVVFVSRAAQTSQLAATANDAGQFAVNLPAGNWKMYLSRADGSLEYHSAIDLQDRQQRNVMVVSR